MPSQGDRNTIRIGGDASGPVVAGHDNHVEIHHAPPAIGTGSAPDEPPDATGSAQINTADGHGTVFTVMNSDMHVHDDATRTPQDG
ncbi:hypothetical protein ACH427_10900 [Streptomyces sp. NPDC020379]|uniref:hypothetical protein n=1 Tax=Streptomyces sp. NPDC020379 TaxID=3365071 RepID=UPI00378D796B